MTKPFTSERKTVLLVNYGGPAFNEASAKDYLKNLFSDGVVFPLPKPLRWLIAQIVSRKRWRESLEILRSIGGKSPLIEQTFQQADKLQRLLGENYTVKVAMRYSPPYVGEVLREITGEVIVLPLFPHYSIATWKTVLEEVNKSLPEDGYKAVKPFYDCEGFVTGWVETIKEHLKGLKKPFLLFSAHSLPLYLVERYNDPYPRQVYTSAKLIAERLSLPFKVSYQSKLGPIRWLEPSTEEVIKRLATEGVEELVVIPVSFVSENTETLYEIDIYYRNLARETGIKQFIRPPIPYLSDAWMGCFAKLIKEV